LQRILKLFSVILHFSVEFIPHVWEVLLVAASDTQPEPTNMNNKLTRKSLRTMADERGYICRIGKSTPVIRITEDGTIYRADTDLTICRSMTLADAAKALKL
jgi:hypothetical protein